MKKLLNYQRAVNYLNKIFNAINEDYFNNELEKPTITIQSTMRAYGHVTVSKVWKNANGDVTNELNISADYLNRPIENVVATLVHECCHLYAMQNGIKDTSNRGVYHNKKFKALAEERDLIIERHPRYGWTITSPSEKLIDWIISRDFKDILIGRNNFPTFTMVGGGKAANGNSDDGEEQPKKKRSSSIKWVCPCCGNICRTTKVINIKCGDCDESFVMEL